MEKRIHRVDDELVMNENGALQSRIGQAPRLVAGEALAVLRERFTLEKDGWRERSVEDHVIDAMDALVRILIANTESTDSDLDDALVSATKACAVDGQQHGRRKSTIPAEAFLRVAEVYSLGEHKYGLNTWRKISYEDHLDHAMSHLLSWQAGDETDDHLGHGMCRLTFAKATKTKEPTDFKAILFKRTPGAPTAPAVAD